MAVWSNRTQQETGEAYSLPPFDCKRAYLAFVGSPSFLGCPRRVGRFLFEAEAGNEHGGDADPDLPTEGEDETEADDEEDAGKEEAEDEEEKRDPRDISEDAACISVRPVMFEFTQDGEVFQRDLSTGSADATDLNPETAFDLLLQYTIT